ncbi:unnamed protein product [Didymodactylos carnosus]|uniref:Uncharacterized protein n=1 Tax=Didymodactylos carnosus TaxID=1234261 RepID=A0A8S2TRD4_9BILA|nr:unnamed protein product [Didymodactylos carnosus]CAF4301717.1 unnamed protein product [Didymodactylos carnosus]
MSRLCGRIASQMFCGLSQKNDIDGEYFSTLDDMVDKAEYLQTMGLYELIFNVRTKRTVSLKKQCLPLLIIRIYLIDHLLKDFLEQTVCSRMKFQKSATPVADNVPRQETKNAIEA